MGNGFPSADGQGLLPTAANDAEGSAIRLVGAGADGWYLGTASSTWTREA